jgi:hypothetical protein
VFKDIVINLTGPICDCDVQSLGWNVDLGDLTVQCLICKTTLMVPSKKFRARFDLDVKYPGKKTGLENRPVPSWRSSPVGPKSSSSSRRKRTSSEKKEFP